MNIPNNLPIGGGTVEINTQKPEDKAEGLKAQAKRLSSHGPTVKSLAFVGLIAVLVILIILASFTARYATVALKSVSEAAVSLSSKFFESETVSTSVSQENVKVGKNFTISWDHKNKSVGGSYSLKYPCVDGLYLSASTVSGIEPVLCNKEFDFINQNDRLTLVASSTRYHKVDLPITIQFTKNGETSPSITGIINVSIVNDSIKDTSLVEDKTDDTKKTTDTTNSNTNVSENTGKTTTGNVSGQTTSNTYVLGGNNTTTTTSNPNGKADFTVTIMDQGYLDNNSNFVSTPTPQRSYRIAVKFKVTNSGDKTSGPYRFTAFLPNFPQQNYYSDIQPSLNPGDRAEYTIGFDRAVEGNQNFKITVDPTNEVQESNENNNDANITLRIQ